MPRELPLLRNSERSDLKCPWFWHMSWNLGLRPKREPTWAIFGNAWHYGMEFYYPVGRRRGKLQDAIDAALENLELGRRKVGVDLADISLDDDGEPEDGASKQDVELIKADELMEVMFRGYRAEYGLDEEWEVIHTEQPFQIDVPHPKYPGRTLVVYAGTWDLLARHRKTGKLWLWDHKTAKAIPKPDVLELNDQAGTYLWVAKEVLVHKGILTKRDHIEGIIFNYAKKAPADPRPTDAAGRALNKDGTVSKRQPTKRFVRYPVYRTPQAQVALARRVQDDAIIIGKMRRGLLPIVKRTSHDCPRCPLFDLCTLHEQQADGWEDYRDEFFVVKDVYADHREAMAHNGIELGGHIG